MSARKLLRLRVGRTEEALLGVAGIHGLGDKTARGLNLPTAPDPEDDDCDSWAQAIAESLYATAADAPRKLLDPDGDLDGSALLAHAGRLWYLTCRAVALRCGPYFAVGSGDDHALGALHATHQHAPQLAADPYASLQAAIAAACAFRADCAPPVIVEALRVTSA